MARTRKLKPTKTAHASWQGMLRIDLVSIPVQAYNVVSPSEGEIHFNRLHDECHSRIQYKKVCPIHGEVSNDEIVSGYEYEKGKYVVVDPAELDKLRTDAERAFTIDTFIDPAEFDLKYLDGRNYYLAPDGKNAQEAYAVLHAAMSDLGRWGVGTLVFSEREQLAIIRADVDAFSMSLLHHHSEVRPSTEVGISNPKVASNKLTLAKAVVEAATKREFDFSSYRDVYQEQVHKLIAAKIAGKKIVKPRAESENDGQVINLMDALEKSLALSRQNGAGTLKASRGSAKKKPVKRTRKRA